MSKALRFTEMELKQYLSKSSAKVAQSTPLRAKPLKIAASFGGVGDKLPVIMEMQIKANVSVPEWLKSIVLSDRSIAQMVMDEEYKSDNPHANRLAYGYVHPDELERGMFREHWIQVRLFYYVSQQYPVLYDYMFSVPNGGKRDASVASQLSQEGLKAGIQDIFIMIPLNGYHGLMLEVKTEQGTAQKNQKTTYDRFTALGYLCHIEKGYEACKKAIDDYLCYVTPQLVEQLQSIIN